jgi:hypothetical protein
MDEGISDSGLNVLGKMRANVAAIGSVVSERYAVGVPL